MVPAAAWAWTLLLLLPLLLPAALGDNATLDQVWRLPATYEMAAALHLPYVPLSEPILVFTDGTYQSGTQKFASWGGSTIIINSVRGPSFAIQPEMAVQVCRNVTQCVAPRRGGRPVKCTAKGAVPTGTLQHLVPASLHLFRRTDRRIKIQRCRHYSHEYGRFRPVGEGGAYTPGPRTCGLFHDPAPIEAEEWVFAATGGNQTESDGELYVGRYAIYTDPANGNVPLQFRELGHNIIPSSHPDEYIYDYFYIRAMAGIDPEVFEPPTNALNCLPQSGEGDDSDSSAGSGTPLAALHLTMPEGHAARHQAFEAYTSRHKKVHPTPADRATRFRHFHRSHRYVTAFNRQQRSYWLAVNHMADWTPEERAGLRGMRWDKEGKALFFEAVDREARQRGRRHRKEDKDPRTPHEVDWRRRHALRWAKGGEWDPRSRGFFVTPPKDQGTCGSCWAFGAIANIEGQIANITHNDARGHQYPESASEQNLMDCSWPMNNQACGGGLDLRGYEWILKHNEGRIASERTYPYVNENGRCHYDLQLGMTGAVRINGNPLQAKGIGHMVAWGTPAVYHCAPHCNPKLNIERDRHTRDVDVPASTHRLREMVAFHGPITVSIDANPADFYYYGGGIYDNPQCSQVEHDHSVLAAGYGVEADGTRYWLIKNSWGQLWGKDGYMKLAEKGNPCGVVSRPTYVVMTEDHPRHHRRRSHRRSKAQ